MIVGALEIQMLTDLARLRRDMGEVRSTTASTAAAVDRAFSGLRNIFATLGIGVLIRQLIDYTDRIVLLEARLRIATKGTNDYEKSLAAIYKISQNNNQALESTAALFSRLNPLVQKLGGNMNYTAGVTEAVALALRVSGASTNEAASTMLQFSQAMASGVLRGEEFNAVSENGSRILTALENQLGKSRGELRQMAEQGKLTAAVVGNVLIKELENLRKEGAVIPLTFSGALQRIKNDLLILAGEFNKGVGVVGYFVRALEFLRINMLVIADLFGRAVVVVAAYFLLIKGGAAIFAAYTAAVAAATAAKTAFMLRASLLGPVLAGLSFMMGNATAASFALVGGFTALQAAVGVLIAAFAGWQIGTWMRDNFLQAQLAGIAFVNGTLKGWEAIRYGAGVAWVYIVEAFDSALSNMGKGIAWFLRLLGDGLEKLGLSEASSKMLSWASNVKSATRETSDLGARTSALRSEYSKSIGVIDTITGDMADYAISQFNAKRATDASGQSIKLLEEAEKKATATKRELAAVEKARVAALVAAAALQNEIADEALRRDAEQLESTEKQIRTAREYLEQVEYETEALRMTTAERAVASAARDLERQGIEKGTLAYDAFIEKIRQAVLTREQVQESVNNAKDHASEITKINDQIGQSLSDSLFRAFESGGGGLRAFLESAKNLLKSTVLRIALQPVQAGVSGFANALFGTSTSGGGSSFLGNAVSGMSSAAGGGGMMSTVSSFASIAGTIGAAGTALGSGIGAGIMGTLSGAGAATFGAGASMASGAIGAGSAVGAAGGTGLIVGAALPYVAAISAVVAAYQALRHRPTPHQGSVVSVDSEGQAQTMYGDASQILNNFHSETDAALRGIGGLTTATLNSIDTAFGGLGEYSTLLKFAADGNDASIGSFQVNRAGQSVNEFGVNSDYNFYSADREQALSSYTLDVARATRAALEAMDLPEWARDQLSALGSSATLEQIVATASAIAQVQTALTDMRVDLLPLGGIFADMSKLSSDALYELVSFTGGLEQFAAKTAGFVQNYFTEDEQSALQAGSILQELQSVGLNAEGLGSRADLRLLATSIDVSTEQGRRQVAAILNIQQAFASVGDYLLREGMNLGQLAAVQVGDFATIAAAAAEAARVAEEARLAAQGGATSPTGGPVTQDPTAPLASGQLESSSTLLTQGVQQQTRSADMLTLLTERVAEMSTRISTVIEETGAAEVTVSQAGFLELREELENLNSQVLRLVSAAELQQATP